jgi:hypothetical protein
MDYKETLQSGYLNFEAGDVGKSVMGGWVCLYFLFATVVTTP